jgi:hypothetical protein
VGRVNGNRIRLAALLLVAGCGTSAGSDELRLTAADDAAETREGTDDGAGVDAASDDGTDANQGTGRGLGPEADPPASGSDQIEVRRVVSSPDEEPQDAEADQLPTTFGRYAVHVGVLTDADNGFEEPVTAMSEARYIDTCGVTLDLSNPVYEAVFLDGGEELAHLGYYEDLGHRWGNCNVRGLWMDEDWGLLAVTTELPIEPLGR